MAKPILERPDGRCRRLATADSDNVSADGQPDRQISIESVWRWFLDWVFAIHRRSVLEPRTTPIDKNAYCTKSTFFTLNTSKLQKILNMETIIVEGEFVRQIPMRDQLFTCSSKIGEENGRKSALERGLRTDKYRYIEASRVTSYRFFSVGRLLETILASLWVHLELKNRLGGSMRLLF